MNLAWTDKMSKSLNEMLAPCSKMSENLTIDLQAHDAHREFSSNCDGEEDWQTKSARSEVRQPTLLDELLLEEIQIKP